MPNKAGLAERFFGKAFETLSHHEQRVIHDIIERRRTTRNVGKAVEADLTVGQRLAEVLRLGQALLVQPVAGLVHAPVERIGEREAA